MRCCQGKFFLAFCFLAAFVLVATVACCQRETFDITNPDSWDFIYNTTEGKVLRGHYVRKRVRSLFECFDECLRCHACVSINYVKTTFGRRHICHINHNIADPNNGIKLHDRKNSTYYEVDRVRLSEV